MNKLLPLNLKDHAIIKAFPSNINKKLVLNVGCSNGRIDYWLAKIGYKVYAIDLLKDNSWQNNNQLTFSTANIFDLSSFPITSAPIVICSQVLEHLINYKKALINLLKLTEIRLILTVPLEKSFYHPEHVNFWDDGNIKEFTELCKPHSISISKIITKSEDAMTGQRDYLIIIDKRQKNVI